MGNKINPIQILKPFIFIIDRESIKLAVESIKFIHNYIYF